MLAPPAKRQRSAAAQARWRARRRRGELLVRVVTAADDRRKLAELGYLTESQKADRHEVGAAIGRLLTLMKVDH
jgi:hypothetical protein